MGKDYNKLTTASRGQSSSYLELGLLLTTTWYFKGGWDDIPSIMHRERCCQCDCWTLACSFQIMGGHPLRPSSANQPIIL